MTYQGINIKKMGCARLSLIDEVKHIAVMVMATG